MHSETIDNRLILMLLGIVGLAVLPHAQYVSPTATGIFWTLLLWRILTTRYRRLLPGRLAVFLLLALSIALLIIERQGILGRDAGSSLLVIALALKLMEMRRERDVYLIIYMTFIVAATQFLYEQNIFLCVYNISISGLLFTLLITLNGLYNKLTEAFKLSGSILLQAAPLAAAMFILFPRLEPPKWLTLRSESKLISGLSDTLEPGSMTNLSMSDELVFRAQFDGPIPPPSLRYWRGPVMTLTNGRLWTQSPNSKNYGNKIPKANGMSYRYTLLMEPQTKNWVFALDMPFVYPGSLLTRNPNYQLQTQNNPEERHAYNITSYPNYNTGTPSPPELKDATQLPVEPSERIKNFVRDLHGYDAPATEFIRNVLNHFRRENFRYTLQPPLLDENPVDTFLFETRAGFCSHYASAFVYLMRAANIPARIVTGFQGGEVNALGRFIRVRQADAHAWAEVLLENRGWVRFDPTAAIAPERIEFPMEISVLARGEEIVFDLSSGRLNDAFNLLRQGAMLWQTVDYQWQRWIIGYNSTHQFRFLSELGIRDNKDMVFLLTGTVMLMTLLLSTSILHRKKDKIDPTVQAYALFCKKLARLGVIKLPGEGPNDFAERAKAGLPQHADAIDKISKTFIGLRYENPTTNDLSLKFLKRLVSLFKP